MPRATANTVDVLQIKPSMPHFEAFRTLRINLEFSTFDRSMRSIAVTSANQGEGKTTTAVHLAAAYAEAGKKVVLVDADLRKPSVHLFFSEDNNSGLTNYLANQIPLNVIIKESLITNLSVITSGPVPPNTSELLASARLNVLLDELKQSYDIVIVDTPPVLPLTDVKLMAAVCDGVLLVIEYGKVKRATAKKVKEDLAHVKANLLGVVLNKLNRKDAEAYLY